MPAASPEIGGGAFGSAIFLGSGDGFGAARESALKMLEMTAGRVKTFAETFLGLRHGPMSAVHDDTLLVCYLSCDPMVRAYERDLIGELNAKGVRAHAVSSWASNVPAESGGRWRNDDRVPRARRAGRTTMRRSSKSSSASFWRSSVASSLGLRPDEPSAAHIITRVVSPFRIHRS